MSDPDFYIKRGDNSPALKYQVPAFATLVGASVQFQARDMSGLMVIDKPASILVPETVGGAVATVAYTWNGTDTDIARFLQCEFKITLGGVIETTPNDGFLLVQVYEDVR